MSWHDSVPSSSDSFTFSFGMCQPRVTVMRQERPVWQEALRTRGIANLSENLRVKRWEAIPGRLLRSIHSENEY